MWQPIETAPKDSSWCVVCGPLSGKEWEAAVAAFDTKNKLGWYVNGDDCHLWVNDPTHWMPLPEPPNA